MCVHVCSHVCIYLYVCTCILVPKAARGIGSLNAGIACACETADMVLGIKLWSLLDQYELLTPEPTSSPNS